MFRSFFGNRANSNFATVNVAELKNLIENKEDLLLVDVRSPYEYERDGHIEGTILIPLQELMFRYEELPKDKPLIFICRSGNRSNAACEQMVRLGFDDVTNFAGGMIDWKRAGNPVE